MLSDPMLAGIGSERAGVVAQWFCGLPNAKAMSQEALNLEILIPTSTTPTEVAPVAPEEINSLASTLQQISQDLAGLRKGCEGNYGYLYEQIQTQGTAITAQLTSHSAEIVGRITYSHFAMCVQCVYCVTVHDKISYLM